MCGILCIVSGKEHVEISDNVLQTLKARGPDSLVIHRDTYPSSGHENVSETCHISAPVRYLTFASSVLSLRGDEVLPQPLVDPATGSVLCWNGEAWKIRGQSVTGCDSQAVFGELLEAAARYPKTDRGEPQVTKRSGSIVQMLTEITGPYAFVFYDAPAAILYFGRDRLGRRSLISQSTDKSVGSGESISLLVSSFETDVSEHPVEVSTSGISCLNLRQDNLRPSTLEWPTKSPRINNSIPDAETDIGQSPSITAVQNLGQQLYESLRPRVTGVPTYNTTDTLQSDPSRIAVLFSGGLDCTSIARLCHDILPIEQPIDLLNVAFENPRTINAAARVNNGLVPTQISPFETCPDRLTGRSSFAELVTVCPGRSWRFVAINIPYSEVQSHRKSIIQLMQPHNTEMDLSIAMALYFAARGKGVVTQDPHAIDTSTLYTTTARVLLSGLGADELFGGYTRHAVAFSRGGWQALIDELELDFTRIGSRNLGRDDRVMAHWAREVRYPYLDEDFVSFALQLPVWEKCGFRSDKTKSTHFDDLVTRNETEDTLEPAKMILRCLTWRMGMKKAASEKKRAIQFGARTAKMEGGKTKGTDVLSAI